MPLPSVSVIIPVRHSQRTIALTLQSLFTQIYDGTISIILVGGTDDDTWSVDAVYDPRVTRLNIDTRGVQRDSNLKRNAGLAAATGDILALTDSDMVLPPNWIATGIAKLSTGAGCVCGGMRSVDQSFWGRYVDGVEIGSKTPRMRRDTYLDAATFGLPGHKPPITANCFITRQVYATVGGLDTRFQWSYDDYPWFWQMAAAGFPIRCTGDLDGDHHHRFGKKLLLEYCNSGKGCADMVRFYPACTMAAWRMGQLIGVGSLGLLALFATFILLACGALGILAGVMGGILALLLVLGAQNAITTCYVPALLFPYVTAVLALAFCYGMTTQLLEVRRRAPTSLPVAV